MSTINLDRTLFINLNNIRIIHFHHMCRIMLRKAESESLIMEI